jgi:prephenate dehydratase
VPLVNAACARVVAYLGGHGSFSEEACRRFAPAYELMPFGDFPSVARAVCQGSADLAVLPVANTHVGPIAAVRSLLAHPELRIVGEEVLGIRLHLLGLRGARLDGITQVSSHAAALTQCRSFLAARRWAVTPLHSTAEAARQVASAANPARAAIGSDAAANAYDLAILARDLQGEGENLTRFAIVERRDQFA